eukprot:3395563-Pyramimonas_sp.AAC.1
MPPSSEPMAFTSMRAWRGRSEASPSLRGPRQDPQPPPRSIRTANTLRAEAADRRRRRGREPR